MATLGSIGSYFHKPPNNNLCLAVVNTVIFFHPTRIDMASSNNAIDPTLDLMMTLTATCTLPRKKANSKVSPATKQTTIKKNQKTKTKPITRQHPSFMRLMRMDVVSKEKKGPSCIYLNQKRGIYIFIRISRKWEKRRD